MDKNRLKQITVLEDHVILHGMFLLTMRCPGGMVNSRTSFLCWSFPAMSGPIKDIPFGLEPNAIIKFKIAGTFVATENRDQHGKSWNYVFLQRKRCYFKNYCQIKWFQLASTLSNSLVSNFAGLNELQYKRVITRELRELHKKIKHF